MDTPSLNAKVGIAAGVIFGAGLGMGSLLLMITGGAFVFGMATGHRTTIINKISDVRRKGLGRELDEVKRKVIGR